jgi:hypothetical protein
MLLEIRTKEKETISIPLRESDFEYLVVVGDVQCATLVEVPFGVVMHLPFVFAPTSADVFAP